MFARLSWKRVCALLDTALFFVDKVSKSRQTSKLGERPSFVVDKLKVFTTFLRNLNLSSRAFLGHDRKGVAAKDTVSFINMLD
jgi:hypothetical protein